MVPVQSHTSMAHHRGGGRSQCSSVCSPTGQPEGDLFYIFLLSKKVALQAHDMGSTLQIDLPRDWVNLALHRDMWGGQPVLSFEQCFILFSSFPLLLAFVVGGLGFEFYVFVAGWRHALRSEWPFHHIIIIVQVSRSR